MLSRFPVSAPSRNLSQPRVIQYVRPGDAEPLNGVLTEAPSLKVRFGKPGPEHTGATVKKPWPNDVTRLTQLKVRRRRGYVRSHIRLLSACAGCGLEVATAGPFAPSLCCTAIQQLLLNPCCCCQCSGRVNFAQKAPTGRAATFKCPLAELLCTSSTPGYGDRVNTLKTTLPRTFHLWGRISAQSWPAASARQRPYPRARHAG